MAGFEIHVCYFQKKTKDFFKNFTFSCVSCSIPKVTTFLLRQTETSDFKLKLQFSTCTKSIYYYYG